MVMDAFKMRKKSGLGWVVVAILRFGLGEVYVL